MWLEVLLFVVDFRLTDLRFDFWFLFVIEQPLNSAILFLLTHLWLSWCRVVKFIVWSVQLLSVACLIVMLSINRILKFSCKWRPIPTPRFFIDKWNKWTIIQALLLFLLENVVLLLYPFLFVFGLSVSHGFIKLVCVRLRDGPGLLDLRFLFRWSPHWRLLLLSSIFRDLKAKFMTLHCSIFDYVIVWREHCLFIKHIVLRFCSMFIAFECPTKIPSMVWATKIGRTRLYLTFIWSASVIMFFL